MKRQSAKILRFFLVPMAMLLILTGVSASQESKTSQPSPTGEKKPAPGEKLADLVPLASELANRLVDLEKGIETGFDLSVATKSFERITQSLDDVSSKLEKVKISKQVDVAQLMRLKGRLLSEDESFKGVTKTLTAAISEVELSRSQWSEEKNRWSELKSSLPEDVPLIAVEPAFSKADESIQTALGLIDKRLTSMVAAQQEAGDLQTRLHKLTAEVDALLLAGRGDLFSKSAPSMFSSAYFSELGRGLRGQLRIGPRAVLWPRKKFFSQNGWVIFLQALVALVFSLGILRHRQFLEGAKRWRFLAKRPFAAGLLFGVSMLMWLYRPLPAVWDLVCLTVISIALARLLGILLAVIWKRRLVYGLALFVIALQLFQIIGLPLPVFRLFLFCVSLIGLFLCVWRSMASAHRGDSALYTWALRLGGCIFLLVLAAELGGYSALALRLLESSLNTTLILLAAWMLMLLARGGLELTANSSLFQNIPFLSSRAEVIVRRFAFFVNIIIAFVVFAFILLDIGLYQSHLEAIRGVFSLGFNMGSWRISTGLMMTAAAVLYGSFLVSWAIQAALLEGVFSGRDIDTGVQFSVAKLVHYGLIFVGFLLALVALGVDLKNVTIIGGALGVGIGFGLQTIVNNFVCGLILLFERPIKVGDYIEYNNDWAEIKKIGLRSTIVKTFDRADIVVPNSTLITNDIINWTHSDRFARIRLPIGVAYGSDVSLVMKTVLECAEENPSIMRAPAPKIYFRGFGESSLNFELRVHLSDIDEWYPAQTTLLQEIDRRFREAGIQIPFPQRDVHVQSAGESPAPSLAPSKEQRPDQTASSSNESVDGD
jgi:small-conductance mechanosensitive channel